MSETNLLYGAQRAATLFLVGILICAVLAGGMKLATRHLTGAQQKELTIIARQIAHANPKQNAGEILSDLKHHYGVERISQISYWKFEDSKTRLRRLHQD